MEIVMGEIQRRHYSTITLTCYESGGVLVLLDARGKRISSVPKPIAKELSADRLSQFELRRMWSLAANSWVGANHSSCQRRSRSEWDRKASIWLASVRIRRNRTRPLRIRTTDRQCSRWHRKNWDEAIRRLLMQYFSSLRKESLRRENPWILWAETVVANLKTRGVRHAIRPPTKISIVRHETGITSEARVAAAQMRIEW